MEITRIINGTQHLITLTESEMSQAFAIQLHNDIEQEILSRLHKNGYYSEKNKANPLSAEDVSLIADKFIYKYTGESSNDELDYFIEEAFVKKQNHS
ncbi:MAG: hypothetical protein ACI4JS_08585 [Oscillospiraceae bacterium]